MKNTTQIDTLHIYYFEKKKMFTEPNYKHNRYRIIVNSGGGER